MRQWLKANGGPLAVVVVGLALTGFTTSYGWIVVVVGVLWWLAHFVYPRLPWEVRRKGTPHRRSAAAPMPEAARRLIAPTPHEQLSRLINEGLQIRQGALPSFVGRSARSRLLASLVFENARGPAIERWNEKVVAFLDSSVPTYAGLYTNVKLVSSDEVEAYLDARIAELREILRRL